MPPSLNYYFGVGYSVAWRSGKVVFSSINCIQHNRTVCLPFLNGKFTLIQWTTINRVEINKYVLMSVVRPDEWMASEDILRIHVSPNIHVAVFECWDCPDWPQFCGLHSILASNRNFDVGRTDLHH